MTARQTSVFSKFLLLHHTTIHVHRAKDGDTASLTWLVHRFSPLLLAQANYRLRGKALDVEPEDIVQDVWAVALPALPSLTPREGRETPVLLKFMATTMLYRINELLRQQIRRRASAEAAEPPGLSQLPANARGAVTEAATRENYQLVLGAIDQLPTADREVVVLRAIEQHSNAEVAAMLQQTPNAVSLRFNRAMHRLQEQFADTVIGELQPGE